MSRAHLVEGLRARGFRITVAREAILDILSKEHSPLSAADIREVLLRKHVTLDKVTVYRELDFLEAQGTVYLVQLQDGHRRYELASREHHHHLVCEACHGVEDVHVKENLSAQERSILKEKKFKVLRHSLEFFGLCEKCQ